MLDSSDTIINDDTGSDIYFELSEGQTSVDARLMFYDDWLSNSAGALLYKLLLWEMHLVHSRCLYRSSFVPIALFPRVWGSSNTILLLCDFLKSSSILSCGTMYDFVKCWVFAMYYFI